MAKKRSRTETVLVLMVLAAGGLLTAIAGLFAYIYVTTTPLHPDVQNVPSTAPSQVPAKWAGAVEQGRQLARAGLVEQNLPALSVAVGVGGELVWAEAFGYADLEKKVPVRPEMRFRIGEVSIPLTSAAVGLLFEKNKLKLDDEIQTYVPEFPSKQWPVTVQQVMGHVAGIGSDGGDEGPLFSEQCERPVDALQFFANRSLLFEPGTRYRFSRYGWIVVSAVVEAAAGKSFLSFMREQVFAPLGMNDTRAEPATTPSPERPTFYFPRFAADPKYGPDVIRDINLSCYAGSGAFLSTASDIVRFGIAINSGKLLQPATLQLLQTRQRLQSGEETGYGLGWDLENVTLAGQQTRAVGHDGDVLGGMVASLMTFRERGIVVAAISNTSYAKTSAIALRIANALAEEQKRNTTTR